MAMRKIYLVPNIVTTANLFSGFYSIILSTQKSFVMASVFILIAAVFDALDGRIARLAKATSQFGVEYDSLSDLVSFGMAPGLMLYFWGLEGLGRFGILAAFLYTACGALRLARFNLNTGVVSKKFFQGVPSPIAAGSIASFVIFQAEVGIPSSESVITLQISALAQALILGSLMVSTIPFPSFKEFHWRSRSSFGFLLVAMMMLVLIILSPEVNLFLINLAYLVMSLGWNAYRVIVKRPVSIKIEPPTSSTGV
jgi:CDP-diacylglycerol---serine O-phosphatidyltransferase